MYVEPSPERLQALEASLRDAIKSAQAEGVSIFPFSWGVYPDAEGRYESRDRACCPLGAALRHTQACELARVRLQEGRDDDLRNLLGLTKYEISEFINGFDRGIIAGTSDGTRLIWELGARLRHEFRPQTRDA